MLITFGTHSSFYSPTRPCLTRTISHAGTFLQKERFSTTNPLRSPSPSPVNDGQTLLSCVEEYVRESATTIAAQQNISEQMAALRVDSLAL